MRAGRKIAKSESFLRTWPLGKCYAATLKNGGCETAGEWVWNCLKWGTRKYENGRMYSWG